MACVHEKLHNLGIPDTGHAWIYRKHDGIVDETCLKLLYIIGPNLKSPGAALKN